MRVTLLGHATVLVEMGPMKILMDPILQDPFEDGMVVSCPKREIDIEQLPPIDVIVISHQLKPMMRWARWDSGNASASHLRVAMYVPAFILC